MCTIVEDREEKQEVPLSPGFKMYNYLHGTLNFELLRF